MRLLISGSWVRAPRWATNILHFIAFRYFDDKVRLVTVQGFKHYYHLLVRLRDITVLYSIVLETKKLLIYLMIIFNAIKDIFSLVSIVKKQDLKNKVPHLAKVIKINIIIKKIKQEKDTSKNKT